MSLPSFLLRNGVQLCAMGTIVKGQFTIHLTELKLPILIQISHSSSILALRKVCIVKEKSHILFDISFTLWLGLKQGVRAGLLWNPKCCVQHWSCPRYLLYLNQEPFTIKIPQVSQILWHYVHTSLKVSQPKKPMSKFHQSAKSTNEDLLFTAPKRHKNIFWKQPHKHPSLF